MSPTQLMCALYDLDEQEVRGLREQGLVRSDVPGLVTCLAIKNGDTVRNADAAAIKAAGLTLEQAWDVACRNTRELLGEVVEEEVSEEHNLWTLMVENSLAIHSVPLFWHQRPEWTGSTGSAVAYVDRHTYLLAKCDAEDKVGDAINAVVSAFQLMVEDEEALPPRLWWRDAGGFELIEADDDGLVVGPRLRKKLGIDAA